ncbi:MAG: hypothetical protein VR68_04535 [Peptococcaceae bacterium BRH_c4a]|nr:MAG: hypothetical protein VR68_04535 [Peptococcaceae bacterium BRH_c4a]
MSQDWKKYREQWMKASSKKGINRDVVPDKACGYCEKFQPSGADGGGGSGICTVLKNGSDIAKGVYVKEGGIPMPTLDIMDGGSCEYFNQIKRLDTNTTEVWNPSMRANRLFKER